MAGAQNHLDNNTAHATSVQRFKAPFSSGHTTAAGRDARSPLRCGAEPDDGMKQRALGQCRAFHDQDPGGLACPHSGCVVYFTIKIQSALPPVLTQAVSCISRSRSRRPCLSSLRLCRAFHDQDPGGLACPHSGCVVYFTIKIQSALPVLIQAVSCISRSRSSRPCLSSLRLCRAFHDQDPVGLAACPHSGCVVQPGRARKVLVVMFPSGRRLKGTKPRVLFKLVVEENEIRNSI